MKEREKAPQLDPSTIRFPTDAITLGQMRQHEPGLFTYDALLDNHGTEIDAVATHLLELVLAERAFSKAFGRPDPHPDSSRQETISMLNDAYRLYGLSNGIQQTRQLTRDIEAAASRQAETLRGPTR